LDRLLAPVCVGITAVVTVILLFLTWKKIAPDRKAEIFFRATPFALSIPPHVARLRY